MTREHAGKAMGAPLRIGVLGAGGQLGRCLVREVEAAPDLELAFAATRDAIDLTDTERIGEWLDALAESSGAAAQVVVNAAAYTRVDACESESALAYQVNGLAPAEWARALAARGIRFLHLSTDYVFPGDGEQPYREEDPSDPRTVYGASKRAGEVAVLGTDPTALVVRTSWVFGPGRNFVVAILDQARKRRMGEAEGPLQVVDDQRGSPTSAADLARALLILCRKMGAGHEGVTGLLHLCNSGVTTWYGFARKALELAGYGDVEVDPVPTSAFPTAAMRPSYSVLSCDRAARLGVEMRPWPEALAGYLSGPDRPESVESEARHGASSAPADSHERSTRTAQEVQG